MRTVWVEMDGVMRKVELEDPATDGSRVCRVDGQKVVVDHRGVREGEASLRLVEGTQAGRQLRCVVDGDEVVVDGVRRGFALVDPRSMAGTRGAAAGLEGPRMMKAPMPGRVVRVMAAAGENVVEQQGLVVIEAMKMQNELKSPKTGRLMRVVEVGSTVGSGEVLAVVE